MVYFPMKRGREEEEEEMKNLTSMANYLMLLSNANNNALIETMTNKNSIQPSRVFECKTCNRQFPSFQALGGHRASHKKPRIMEGDTANHHDRAFLPAKPKTHECSICGLEFAIGQALGGHMRRHRTAVVAEMDGKHQSLGVSVLKRANSGRRVFGLDLNLTPLENDNLEFGIGGKMTSLVELCL